MTITGSGNARASAIRGSSALQWLDRAYTQRDAGLLSMIGEPLLKNISSEPRFHAILRAMNLPEWQLLDLRPGGLPRPRDGDPWAG
jgi:hypothetical protein